MAGAEDCLQGYLWGWGSRQRINDDGGEFDWFRGRVGWGKGVGAGDCGELFWYAFALVREFGRKKLTASFRLVIPFRRLRDVVCRRPGHVRAEGAGDETGHQDELLDSRPNVIV